MIEDWVSGVVSVLLGDGASWSTIIVEGEPVDAAGSEATTLVIGAMTSGVGHMFGAAGVQTPENNLDNLHSSREEDGTLEAVDPQDLLGCDPLALVDGFTHVEDNTGLLETRFDEEALFVIVFPEDVTRSVNLTLLSLFVEVTATNELLKLGQSDSFTRCTTLHEICKPKRLTQCISATVNTAKPLSRRSANYAPSLWSFEHIQSLSSKYTGKNCVARADSLKKIVKTMIHEVGNPSSALELVDDLQRLGMRKINPVLSEIIPDVAIRAIETQLSSPKEIMCHFCDLTPSGWRVIDHAISGKLRDKSVKESWELAEDVALYDNESWNYPRDLAKPIKAISLPQDVASTFDRHFVELENFAKPIKAISLPQDVTSTSDRHFVELENKVQCLLEAHITPKLSV
uniref:R-linalool synthase QH1, chloroplastic-like n=1 Tax=Tanacetum cinerariifolium TaxID=118510 RepID=A0A6L2N882_TANCI|nr:R-linalool synthase QH1, chloroplastic-like [Tanacetum cinerariifolium]